MQIQMLMLVLKLLVKMLNNYKKMNKRPEVLFKKSQAKLKLIMKET